MGKNLFKNLFINMLKTQIIVDLKLCKKLIHCSFTRYITNFTHNIQLIYTKFSTINNNYIYLLFLFFTHFTHRTTNTTTI